MAKAKEKKRTPSSRSSTQRNTARKSRSGFTPEELRLFPRFLASKTGRWVIAIVVILLLLMLNALVAGRKVDIFFLLTGIELLIGILAFWVFLLYKRTSKTV
ncbi:MAG TPA: hypothetical protein PL100_01325 [Bacillota bacterium]|jgi:hypothetical protein|nr:hypothetical protein [Bacillota bacterium]HQC48157.1 hypothetical protein [Bacillota bacterium]